MPIDPLMWIEWIDSHGADYPWAERSIETDNTTIVTIGFLLRSEDDWIVCYTSFDERNGMIGDVFWIPRGCIKRMVSLDTPST